MDDDIGSGIVDGLLGGDRVEEVDVAARRSDYVGMPASSSSNRRTEAGSPVMKMRWEARGDDIGGDRTFMPDSDRAPAPPQSSNHAGTVPGGTATSTVRSLAAVRARGAHDIVGLAARHSGPPVLDELADHRWSTSVSLAPPCTKHGTGFGVRLCPAGSGG